MGEIVLGAEIVFIVGSVDGLNVVEELFERLSIAVRIEERGERLIEFVESFESGENEVGLLQVLAHGVGHLYGLERRIEGGGMGGDERGDFRFVKDFDSKICAILAIEGTHKALEGVVDTSGNGFGDVVRSIEAKVADDLSVTAVQPQVVAGAQSKKGE